MSNNIPFEVQEEIIKRFPVKSLIQFRSVSKAWKFLIDSPEFAAAHSVIHHAHSHSLLVRYKDLYETQKKYVCFVDDHSFPQKKFAPTLPLSVKLLEDVKVVGSSHGLFCFSGYDPLASFRKKTAVVWNPSIRKSVAISLPSISYANGTVFGFGVCPITTDLKILTGSKRPYCADEIKVFTLSLGAWRSLTISCSLNLNYSNCSQVVTDRFIYWLVSNKSIAIDGCFQFYNVIISFNLTNDEFGEVHLPHSLALSSSVKLSSSKIRESLVLIEEVVDVNKQCIDVWMMADGCPKTFIKVFTFDALFVSLQDVLGFRKTNDAILEVQNDSDIVSGLAALAIYEPVSQHMDYPIISGSRFSFSVFSYTETLLLLNHPSFLWLS